MSEGRDVYDIIAEMSIDYKKIELLNDITFEANLLMRSRFVERRTVDIEGFFKLLQDYQDKDIVITSRLNGRRFIAYIEKGTIISTALSDPSGGRRTAGLRPLAQLLLQAMKKPVTLRVFVVEKEERVKEEEKHEPGIAERELGIDLKILEKATRPLPRRSEEHEETGEKKEITKEVLEEFRQKIIDAFEDVLNYKGYRLVSLDIEYDGKELSITVGVKKKKLFGAAKLEELQKALENEADITLKFMEIRVPFRISVVKKKK